MGKSSGADFFYGATASCWCSRLVAVHPAALRSKLGREGNRFGLRLGYRRRCSAPLHLHGGDVLLVRGDGPLMSERIAQGAGAVAIKLILYRAEHLSAR